MTEELKPCPFCGGKPIAYDMLESLSICTVECSSCDITVEGRTTEATATKWNTRALTQRPEAQEGEAFESVLIDGVAYDLQAPVAAELLRLHLELQARESLPTQPAAQADAPRTCPDACKSPEKCCNFGCQKPAKQATPEPSLLKTFLSEADRAGVTHLPATFATDLAAATPEPVGDVVWIQPGHLQKARVAPHLCRVAPSRIAPDFVPLTRPAPGVPEGLPAVLTDWGFDVHDDEEGRTWLTIRNPDDDVARMSVPTVWPLNGNQTIGAVVLHQFSAALTSALAAAQAKGVW